MDIYYIIIIIALVFVFVVNYVKKNKNKIDKKNNLENKTFNKIATDTKEPIITEKEEKFPYIITQNVFTNKESKFYNSLIRITDKYGLIVFTKMRIADLIYLPKNHPEYIKWFNYIRAKHIDFVVCDKNQKPILLIEVDDSTHDKENRKKRDDFVNKIFNQLQMPIIHIRIWNNVELERQIVDILQLKETVI